MPFYKSPFADATALTVHKNALGPKGKLIEVPVELDIVNGFVEISESDHTPEIEALLTRTLGFTLASPADVDATLATQTSEAQQKSEASARAELLATIKAWGLKIDGRKSLAWVQERYDEFVAQGLIKPGEPPHEVGADAEADPEPA